MRGRRWLYAALMVGVALAIAVMLRGPRDRAGARSRIVVVELQVANGRVAQLFWSSDLGFAEERSTRALLSAGRDVVQRLRFPVPAARVRWLRLDPTDAAGEIVIQRVQIVDENGMVLDIPANSLRPVNEIAKFTPEGSSARIETVPGATDPFLYISVSCLEPPPISVVSPVPLALVSVAAFALVVAAIVLMGRSVFAYAPANPRSVPALWLGALLLVVFGAKLFMMHANAIVTPFWDQWDGEAAVFVPMHGCSLSWRAMFNLHNEHRTFFSRLLSLELLTMNGQWDPRLEQVMNAVIHTATAGFVASMFWLAAGRKRLDLAVVLTALAFGLPFAWENILIGFQSAFYLLLLFSMLALWLTTMSRVGSGRWWVGWACATCALFTAASGLLAAVVIGGVTLLQAASGRARWRDFAINLVMALAVFGLGYTVASPPLPHHEVYRVKSIAEFLTAAGKSLAWPRVGRPELTSVSWLPVALVAIGVLRRRFRSSDLERLSLGVGAWVAMHAVALAYARGAGGAGPATRYMDFLSLGFLANAMAFACLRDRSAEGSLQRKGATLAFGVWLLFAIVGTLNLSRQTVADFDALKHIFASHTQLVRRFVLTGDVSAIVGKAPMEQIPYPDANRLVSILRDPYIRQILPAAIRTPVHLAPRTTDTAFVRDGVYDASTRDPILPSWGSFSATSNAAQGRFESEPIEPCTLSGRLRFELAGHLGYDDHKLIVRELETGREWSVTPSAATPTRWATATVPCPEGRFSIIAEDHSRWSWFAFRPPVEIGVASTLAETLIASSWNLLVAGVVLAAAAARWR